MKVLEEWRRAFASCLGRATINDGDGPMLETGHITSSGSQLHCLAHTSRPLAKDLAMIFSYIYHRAVIISLQSVADGLHGLYSDLVLSSNRLRNGLTSCPVILSLRRMLSGLEILLWHSGSDWGLGSPQPAVLQVHCRSSRKASHNDNRSIICEISQVIHMCTFTNSCITLSSVEILSNI